MVVVAVCIKRLSACTGVYVDVERMLKDAVQIAAGDCQAQPNTREATSMSPLTALATGARQVIGKAFDRIQDPSSPILFERWAAKRWLALSGLAKEHVLL